MINKKSCLIVGLTGGIGSGKTTVADLFAELGTPVIDTDVISHRLTTEPKVLDELKSSFGNGILKQGTLDRKRLAKIVFGSDADRKKLEAILHPRIRREVFSQLKSLEDHAYVIIVVPLLLESDFHELVDRILVVDIQPELQLKRVSERDRRSEDEIRQIISSQIDRDSRLARADDIIENNGDISALDSPVAALHRQYSQIN